MVYGFDFRVRMVLSFFLFKVFRSGSWGLVKFRGIGSGRWWGIWGARWVDVGCWELYY